MRTCSGSANARVALAGNPSDGYGGAVLAVAVRDFGASVEITEAPELRVDPPSALVQAAVRRFAPGTCGRVRWRCDVPMEVGLAGSSAIVVATLRALAAFHERALTVDELPDIALAVEVEDLGMAAGLQDRVAQAYDTLVYMDFSGERPVYEPLDPALLPSLYLAWREDASEASTVVHSDLRARHDGGDAAVVEGMRRLAAHARDARDALVAGDHGAFAASLDASYDERAAMIALDARHVAMVETARAHGATANYAGSGGAVVGTRPDAAWRALERLGCRVIAPRV